MECLTEIIGISDSVCPCTLDGLTDEQKAAIKVSKSGLFLDDLEGMVTLRSLTALDSCKNFAQMTLSARDRAIKKLYADILVALSKKYKEGKGAFVGNVGRPSYATTLQTSKQHQFMRIIPVDNSDAVLKLTGFRIIIDRVGTVNAKIISVPEGGNQGTEVFSGTAEATANTYTNFPLTGGFLNLPLSQNGQKLEYYFVWDKVAAGGANPKDLKIDCNCGFKGNGFSDFIKADGGEMDSTNMLQTRTTDGYSHGISLDVDIRCVPGNLICKEFDKDNAIAITMAWAIMYKTAAIAVQDILDSNEINRYTMMNREALYGKRAHFNKEYETRIVYIASVIDVTSSDCFICRETQMFMTGILS